MMRVAANLTMMFPEAGGLLKRYEAAAAAGFKLVEVAWPYSESLNNLIAVKERLGLEQVLINSPLGKDPNSNGMACDPARADEFKETIDSAIRYAKGLKCPRIHVLAGIPPPDLLRIKAEQTYEENLRYAAALMEKEGITCLIEPLSPTAKAGYLLSNCEQALGYIQKINAPNLKLQMDLFHVQLNGGQLTATINRFLPYTGHIQIAQVPDRHEPDSQGEIRYEYIFDLLKSCGSDLLIGCEYVPGSSQTTAGLGWITEYGLQF